MNYHHLYHAGNFADVFKHVVVVGLLASLLRKEAGFCVLDTHAGTGYYDLMTESAQKNKEYTNGIMKVLAKDNPPWMIKRYLGSVQKTNNRFSESRFSSLRYFPGSPFLVRSFLRPQDRLVVSELHPQEYQQLRTAMGFDNQVAVHHLDGYQGLKAFLPPKERRGLVLIDPPYENPDEFKHLTASLALALKRWETGIYAIWYPIKERHSVDQFLHSMKETIHRPMIVAELCVYPEDVPSHLNGSGMLIINPPWKFDQELNENLPWLWQALSVSHQGAQRVYSLKGETP